MGLFVPRPAAVEITDFSTSGFTSPGFVSCIFVVGSRIYGMVATNDTPGKDMPFVYDIEAAAFVTVSGVTGANVPTSPPTSGVWTPPTMAVIGTKVMVTHTGFTGANKIGWFDISTFASPSWNAGDTATNALPSKPTFVINFFDRAYYAVGNTLWFSDVLDALTITNSTNFLVCGDTTDIIALGALPLTTQLGGVTQSMYAFKSKSIFQVTGDLALSTLALNALSAGTGTNSALSLASSKDGLYFMSSSGLRVLNQDGVIGPVIGQYGGGVSVPFINVSVPSRLCLAYNVDTVRVNTQNNMLQSTPHQDWWYNTTTQMWTGSHTFPASLIQPYSGSFVITPVDVTASIWQSDTLPVETSAYIENGSQLTFNATFSPLPLTGSMNMNAVVEASIGFSFSVLGGTINFSAFDENGAVLDYVTKTFPSSGSLWDVAVMGLDVWGGQLLGYQQFGIPWSKPLVFNQIVISATGDAIPGLQIGDLFMRYQQLGWMRQFP